MLHDVNFTSTSQNTLQKMCPPGVNACFFMAVHVDLLNTQVFAEGMFLMTHFRAAQHHGCNS